MRTNPYDLVVFDIDGTLVDDTVFVWETLHRHFSSDPQAIRRVMHQYLDGEITYAQWFEHDILTLKAGGANRASIDQALSGMRLMDGAHETLRALHGAGVKLAVISGSLDLVIQRFFRDWNPFDQVYINRLEFDPRGEISAWTPTPYDMDHKASGLQDLAQRHGIPLSRTAFVGDNFNDVSIARLAGRSLAFNCKSLDLQWAAHATLLERDLRLTLPFLL
jgi:phosphoserine phosphatase